MKIKDLFIVVLAMCLGFALGYVVHGVYPEEKSTDTKTVVVTDTVRYSEPEVHDSVTVDTVVRWMKRSISTTKRDTIRDSVLVYVPIIKKEYQTDQYKAWISGYEAQLDSIEVYNKTITVTKKKRWGVGIQGGIGMTPKGIQPYIGFGVNFNF